MRRVLLVSLAVLLAGCSAADVPDEIVRETVETTTPEKSAGTVVLPPKPSASASDEIVLQDGEEKVFGIYGAEKPSEDHRFQGTWVEVEGGGRYILSYGRVEAFEAWIGKRVMVVGKPYQPEGRAIAGRHLKARIVRLAPP